MNHIITKINNTLMYDLNVNESIYIDILNVFMCYYKHLYGKETDTNMFHDMSNDEMGTETNRCTELFFGIMLEYKENEDDYKFIGVFNPEEVLLDDCEALYILEIDGIQHKVSRSLYALIEYTAHLDWENMKWYIYNLI